MTRSVKVVLSSSAMFPPEAVEEVTSGDHNKSRIFLMELPDEILLKVLSHLSACDALDLLRSVCATCRRLRALCLDPSLWVDVGAVIRARVDLTEETEAWRRARKNYVRHNVVEEVKDSYWKLQNAFCADVSEELHLREGVLNPGTLSLRVRVECEEVYPVEGEGDRRPYFLRPSRPTLYRRLTLPNSQDRDYDLRDLVAACPNLESLRLTGFEGFHSKALSLLPRLLRLSCEGDHLHYSVELEMLGRVPFVEISNSRVLPDPKAKRIDWKFLNMALRNMIGRDTGSVRMERVTIRGFFMDQAEDKEGFLPEFGVPESDAASGVVVVTDSGKRWKLSKTPPTSFKNWPAS